MSMKTNNPACSAIEFALKAEWKDGTGIDFLDAWFNGDFDGCRKWWPEAPVEVYIGADASMPETIAMMKLENGDE